MNPKLVTQFNRLIRTPLLILVIALQSSASFANTNYSEGLQAYLDSNYELAQAMWLKGAQGNHAKSMFNLGLLHQQRKIERADPAKAEKWFALAAKNGYAPASFHLATWLRQKGGDSQRIRQLEQQAAAAGFAPAMNKLGLSNSTNPTSLAAVNTRSVDSQGGRPNTSSNNKQYQRESWIQNLSQEQWTIQMLAFKERSKVHDFIDRHDLHQRAAYFRENSSNGVLYKLIYGAYGSKEQAELARQNLSGRLKEYGPWLRPVANIQQVIAKQ